MHKAVRHLPLVLAFAVCALNGAPNATAKAPDKDILEVQHYTLTMPAVTRFWETFGSLTKVAKDHPELKDSLETDADKHEDLAAIEKRISSSPILTGAIAGHGLTVHEFVLIEMTLFQAALGSAAIPPGPDRARKAAEANINPANLEFVEQHKSEIEALQAKNGAESGG